MKIQTLDQLEACYQQSLLDCYSITEGIALTRWYQEMRQELERREVGK